MRKCFLTLMCIVFTGCAQNNISDSALIQSYEKEQFSHARPFNSVLVGGCFDVLHYGHVQFLTEAKKQGDYLIVALEPDDSIIRYKKRRPVHTHDKRAINLAALRMVDEVVMLPVMNGYEDYFTLVQYISPQVIAITAGDPQRVNKERQARDVDAKVKVVIERIPHYSSTAIINRPKDETKTDSRN